WKSRQAARPQVAIRIGAREPSKVGAEALLDFSVDLTLDGEPLSAGELAALRASTEGLALIRGRWVEIDRRRLDEVLAHWRTVEKQARKEGLTFHEGMRLLSGARLSESEPAFDPVDAEWSQVIAGDWLQKTLARLREPEPTSVKVVGLKAELRPYQQVGLAWLRLFSSLELGACLADDMGLGKTIQVIALLLELAQKGRRPHLLVLPASLIANWQAELARFAPSLSILIAHPSAMPTEKLAHLSSAQLSTVDLVITTYGSVARLASLSEHTWDLVVLHAAHAIKNPGARQTRSCKLKFSGVLLDLNGTPVENRLGDLWSIFDFLNPGLLGSAKVFTRFAKQLAERGDYRPLRNLVRPYLLRRLKSDRRIIADLPDKTEVPA
ncbi:MAG: SNF2-related protein, partial [Polyangia bacterium]